MGNPGLSLLPDGTDALWWQLYCEFGAWMHAAFMICMFAAAWLISCESDLAGIGWYCCFGKPLAANAERIGFGKKKRWIQTSRSALLRYCLSHDLPLAIFHCGNCKADYLGCCNIWLQRLLTLGTHETTSLRITRCEQDMLQWRVVYTNVTTTFRSP